MSYNLGQYSNDEIPAAQQARQDYAERERDINAPMAMVAQSANSSVDSKDGLSVDRLDKFLYEIRLQPMWRREADMDCEYYDGNQLDNATLDDMQRLGIPPLIRNYIRPTIDVALGMEAKTRSDWRVDADREQDEEVAEAISFKLHEAERESHADRACSDAYAGQLKAGLAWVEVSREMDPFRYPYRVGHVNRREIFWDWRAKEPDLYDARYLVRRRWNDCDILELMFPDHVDLIRGLGWSKANWDTALTDSPSMGGRTWMYERDVTIPETDWRDSTRKRMCLYEVWYRVWTRGHVIRTPDGRTIEVDMENPKHAQAIASGMIEPIPAIFPKMRLSWWIGPHRLVDMPSPYKHNGFPYVPFWGYREDLTNIPYGLIRSMRSPQDEVNARLSKMMWLLSAKRVVLDADQVDDIDELRREIARPDAIIVLSAKRNRSNSKFEVESDFQLTSQQFDVLKDASECIQKTAGVYQAMLGDKMAGVTAGVAINSLVEQGTTTLAEVNDNFRFGRRAVGEMLSGFVIEDLGKTPKVVNVDEKFGAKKKKIVLNQPSIENGVQILTNDVQRAMVKVALEDVPSTPSYRAQQLMILSELTKSLPEQIQAFVVPFILEASEMPHRREVADQVRKALGIQSGGDQQTFTKEQVQLEVQKAIEAFVKQSQIELEQRKVGALETDAQTRRISAEAKVKKTDADITHGDAKVQQGNEQNKIKLLDVTLQHDAAVNQPPNRGQAIASEMAS